MIRRALQSFLIVVTVMAIVFACSRKEGAGKSSAATQTIAPAAAQTSPTGTDAMTETVEIQDSRSEAEGGVLTSPKRPATTTVAPAAKKKTRSTKSRPPGSTQ